MDGKSKILGVNSPLAPVGESANTIYINDSYNLNTIPFDVKNIIEIDNIED